MILALSILPVVFTIACGYLLVASKTLKKSHWEGIEILCFRLLLPVMLIKTIAVSELSFSKFNTLILAVLMTLVLIGSAVLCFRNIISHKKLSNSAFTTIFSTTIRWNSFIALAAGKQFIGPEVVTLLAISMVAFIPIINIANIIILIIFGEYKTSTKQIILGIAKNPLIQACLIGLTLNLYDVKIPYIIMETMDIIGNAAIGIGLLCIGSSISFARLMKYSWQVCMGVSLRLILCPGLFLIIANFINLDHMQTLTGVLVLAVPAASNGYIIAKQMGGDAELYVDILAWQTVLSMLTLPLLAVLLSP